MAWTTPKTWAIEEVMTASDLNVHLRDNLNALKNLASDLSFVDSTADYTTTMTSFVEISLTDFSLSMTTSGGDLMIGFVGGVSNTTVGKNVYFDVEINGVGLGGDMGLHFATEAGASYAMPFSFVVLAQNLPASTYTLSLVWCVNGGTARLYCSPQISICYLHPQFWVREV